MGIARLSCTMMMGYGRIIDREWSGKIFVSMMIKCLEEYYVAIYNKRNAGNAKAVTGKI